MTVCSFSPLECIGARKETITGNRPHIQENREAAVFSRTAIIGDL
jgi:hypothetical protein